jgi:hypothetical protein
MNSVSSNAVYYALQTRVPLIEVRAGNNFDNIQSILDYFGSVAGRSLVPEGGAVIVKLGFTGGGGWHNIFVCSTNNSYFAIVIFSYYFPLQCWQYSMGNWQPFNYQSPST